MTADVLVIQGANASAAMLLIWVFLNIWVLTPEEVMIQNESDTKLVIGINPHSWVTDGWVVVMKVE